jgi:copper homeostasis protein
VGTFEAVRAAVDLPLRVMLRSGDGFTIDAGTLAELCGQATRLRAAGATEFVLGFLDGAGALDLGAMTALLDAARPAAWTLHHAFDNAAEPEPT